VRSCDVSPDGERVAFHASIPQEDLFVVRKDGSDLRQLTNDGFRDRHPRWSPDGSRILFQSDRSGRLEFWSIQADGSRLEPVTRTTGESPSYPIWSPDGRRIACNMPERGTLLIDLSLPLEQRRPEPLPTLGAGQVFDASSWSADGAWLAGNTEQGSLPLPGIVLYSLKSRSYSRLTDRGQSPRWFGDRRTLLYRDKGSLLAVDRLTRRVREVLAPPANSSFIAQTVAPDGRTLYVSRATEEGDVCMLTLR
jgi:dipeptidyl aminopeptidase/acylaminoacyl peptidase